MASEQEILHYGAAHVKSIEPTCTACIRKVANTFVKVLRRWLTPEQFAEMQRRNKVETDPQVCHSHDFCDANEAMMEAFTEHGLTADYDPDDAEHTALWNKVWEAAKSQLR